jgi:hypothetical protein
MTPSLLVQQPQHANDAGPALILLASAGFLAIIVFLAAQGARDWRSRRRPHLAVVLAATCLGFFTDGAAHWLLRIHLSEGARPWVIYESFGIETPLWMLPYYPGFFGLGAWVALCALDRGWSAGRFWRAYAALVVGNVTGELLMIHGGNLYAYLGAQPLEVWRLPLLWSFGYAGVGVLMGAFVHVLGGGLHGAQWLLVVPVVGSGSIGFLLLIAWPSLVMMHASASETLVWTSGVLSAGTVLATVSLVARLPARSASSLSGLERGAVQPDSV